MKKKKGFVLVTGCPRSGTSMAMDILRSMFGDDCILGSKFPQKERLKLLQEKIDSETNPINLYSLKKIKMEFELKKNDFEDMNPNGFWECEFTVQGIRYLPAMKEELHNVLENTKILKVVSQGLLSSNVEYIDRIIFMIRNPRSVAKSQERLKRELNVDGSDGRQHNIFENMVIHSPEMFINVSLQALVFMLQNKDVPIQFIEFESLISNPKEQIKKIHEFVPLPGDISKGFDIVEPKLNRSKPEDRESLFWDDAEYIYNALLKIKKLYENKQFDEFYEAISSCLNEMKNPKRNINKSNNVYKCFRSKEFTNYFDCQKCLNDPNFREQLKKRSELIESDLYNHWTQEPCQYECGRNPHKEPLTIKESIINNFWAK